MPEFQPAGSFALFCFVSLVVALIFLAGRALWRAGAMRLGGGLLFYFLLFTAVVASGVPRANVLPWIPLLFLSVLVVALGVGFSRAGSRIGDLHSLRVLTAFQGFRFLLELILHQWAGSGTIPTTMTWNGQNWDILAGGLSLLFAPWAERVRWTAWVAQVTGILLLLNVIRVAVLSLPLPFSWRLTNPLQLVFYLPYAWIAPVCVGMAACAHVITVRKLLRR